MGNAIRAALLSSLTAATKRYTKVKKTEERHPSLRWYRRTALRSSRVTIKAAAWEVMEAAYLKASANGTLPAHARQIMYAARGQILGRTGKQRLDDQYFTQTLLPDYIQQHPGQTAAWDVVFDARGHFAEPHTEKTVPLGTLAVRKYLHDVGIHRVSPPEFRLAGKQKTEFPTCGPRHRFGAILFIEKEGFLPLFDAVHLAERYDLAIMSTKGLSSTAGRQLVDTLCGRRVPLLVLHDFDKAGFSILATLQRTTRRYSFRNRVQAIDLGLRLADVEAQGLEAEEVGYGDSNPIDNLRENGATEEEIAFLYDGAGGGQRVELNAFASDDLVAWIEEKLAAHGIKKVIPDEAELTKAYRRALRVELLRVHIREIGLKAEIAADQAEIPEDLAAMIRERLDADRKLPWDTVMAAVAEEAVEEGEITLPDDELEDERVVPGGDESR